MTMLVEPDLKYYERYCKRKIRNRVTICIVALCFIMIAAGLVAHGLLG